MAISYAEACRQILDGLRDGSFSLGTGGITSSENMAQIGGAPVSTGAGTTDAGTQRVVLPTDQSSIPTTVKQYAGVPSNFAVATADGTVFTLAAGEKGFIQNLDSADALAIKLGASASTSSFNFILNAGSAADDGRGASVQIDDWIGVVSVATMSGTGRYIAWKQAAA